MSAYLRRSDPQSHTRRLFLPALEIKLTEAHYSMIGHFQDLQLRPQSQRLLVLELLNGLMTCHRQALRNLGEESLIGITDLVSGEKDPRNLMIIFSILKAVMVEWDIEIHAEVKPQHHPRSETCY